MSGPGLTDIHAHPAMNAFLWDRDLRRHYGTAGGAFNPLASLSDFPMLTRGGVKVLWSALHVPERELLRLLPLRLLALTTHGGRMLRRLDAWQCLLAMTAEMERQVARAPGFTVAGTNVELDAALAAGDTAIVHTVEGGHVLGAGLEAGDLDGRLARLEQLARRGVASLTLAHLFPNDLAGHAEAVPASQRRLLKALGLGTGVDPDVGLKPAGRAVVERMVELRMVPDVAHCSVKARREVYAQVRGRSPIVATHVGVRSLRDVEYDLDREDARAIAESGGVAGVIFMPHWLRTDDPKDGRDAIWETMRELREWTGSWEHVALGTDFDGFTDPPDDLKSAAELPRVRTLLEEHGLSDADVDAVLGGNARRVLREGWR